MALNCINLHQKRSEGFGVRACACGRMCVCVRVCECVCWVAEHYTAYTRKLQLWFRLAGTAALHGGKILSVSQHWLVNITILSSLAQILCKITSLMIKLRYLKTNVSNTAKAQLKPYLNPLQRIAASILEHDQSTITNVTQNSSHLSYFDSSSQHDFIIEIPSYWFSPLTALMW